MQGKTNSFSLKLFCSVFDHDIERSNQSQKFSKNSTKKKDKLDKEWQRRTNTFWKLDYYGRRDGSAVKRTYWFSIGLRFNSHHPTLQQLTNVFNSSFRVFYTFLCFLRHYMHIVHGDMCSQNSHTHKSWQKQKPPHQPWCPSIDEWMMKMWYI